MLRAPRRAVPMTTALLIVGALFVGLPADAWAQSNSCRDADVAMLSSPLAPWKGTPTPAPQRLNVDLGVNGTLSTTDAPFVLSADGALMDAGTVHATANMSMPGMVMSSGMEARPTGQPGRYEATADFGMAGTWSMTMEWNGPGGQGSVSFQGAVQ